MGVESLARLLLLLFFLAKSCQCGANSLFFRACTADSNRILLCINECETAQPSSDEDFFSTRQVVLDFSTGKVSIPAADKDVPTTCPSLNEFISAQPKQVINVTCANGTIQWELKDDWYNWATLVTAAEESTGGPLWYNAFFFVVNETNRLYFAIDGSNHIYHHGIAMSTQEPNKLWNWTTHVRDSDPGFSPDVMTLVKYEVENSIVKCTIQKPKETSPILFEPLNLIAFPDSQSSMWYRYNDTGLFRLASWGIIDSRINAIISVEGMIVALHPFNDNEEITSFNLEKQIETYKVSRPLALRPSVIMFSISFVLTVVLVVSEVIAQKKAAAEAAAFPGPGHTLGHRDNSNSDVASVLPPHARTGEVDSPRLDNNGTLRKRNDKSSAAGVGLPKGKSARDGFGIGKRGKARRNDDYDEVELQLLYSESDEEEDDEDSLTEIR